LEDHGDNLPTDAARRIVAKLPRRQQLALAAYFFDRKPVSEIAAEFGVSRAAIYKRIREAKAVLGRYADAFGKRGKRIKFRPLSLQFIAI
jgi:predicted DNA-binding protein YlxM (UPF0122 family)